MKGEVQVDSKAAIEFLVLEIDRSLAERKGPLSQAEVEARFEAIGAVLAPGGSPMAAARFGVAVLRMLNERLRLEAKKTAAAIDDGEVGVPEVGIAGRTLH